MLNQFDSFPYSTVNDEVLGKPNKLEIFAAGAIIVTVTVILLLSTCVILLVINLNRLTGAAFNYETEQSLCNPAVTVAATLKSIAAAEDVQVICSYKFHEKFKHRNFTFIVYTKTLRMCLSSIACSIATLFHSSQYKVASF